MVCHTIDEIIQTGYRDFKDNMFCYEKVNGEYLGKTYGEFYNNVWALSEKLLDMGYKGKNIMIYGHNSYYWMVAYLAIITYVGVVVPIDKEWKKRDIINVSSNVNIELIFYSDNLGEHLRDVKIKKVTLEKDILNLINDGNLIIAQGIKVRVENEIKTDRICKILFTSGTTAKPKKVMITELNIMANGYATDRLISINENDIYLLLLPLHHIFATVMIFLYPISMGVSIYISSSLKELKQELQQAKPTILVGVPRLFEKIIQNIDVETMKKINISLKISNFLRKIGFDIRKRLFKDFHYFFGGNIRFMYSGAIQFEYNILKMYQDMGIVILQGYGMTEASPLISCDSINNYRLGSVGKILYNQEYKLIDIDENGIGELCVKGDNIVAHSTSEDGYLHTGDLVYFDEQQWMYIVGRKKRLIITSNGKNVFPDEIEERLLENKYIHSALVYEENNKICADVVGIDEKEIYAYIDGLNNEFPKYKNIFNLNVKEEKVDKLS